jgi:hypothetical protein
VNALRTREWSALVAQFSSATLNADADGSGLVTIADVELPPGWSAPTTRVHFVVPIGFPAAQPDCFWASAELRLASGTMPSNAGVQAVPVLQCPGLWFSWHVTTWRPSVDTLSTYARFILTRFADAR